MKKYYNFLLENNNYIKKISLEDAIIFFKLTPMYETVVEKGIIPKKENLFYRIINEDENKYKNYNLVDPDSITRFSPYSNNNLYNLVISNLKNWTKFPKRDNSLIGGNYKDMETRSFEYDYNKMMIVIPYDYEIGVCPKEDIWYSFKTLDSSLNYFFSIIEIKLKKFNIKVNDENWNKFKKNLIEFDNIRNNFNFNFNINPNYNYIYEKWRKFEITTLELIEKLLDPDLNDFKVINFDGSKDLGKTPKEMWCDSKSLLIDENAWNYFIKNVKNYY